jgi:DNA-binding CsgD family transcriptional regulator
MLNYDTLATIDIVLGATNHQSLSIALQTVVKPLGYTEAVYLSKQGESFTTMTVTQCAPTNSVLMQAIEQYQITLESCRSRYAQSRQNCWLQTVVVEKELGASKTYKSYLIHCCYVHTIALHHVLLCLTTNDDIDSDTRLRQAPFLLHINSLLSQKMASLSATPRLTDDDLDPMLCPLSARELEVLRWTADGKTADEIAPALGITARTVNFHIANVMDTLDVPNKTAAVAKAIIKGWLFEGA